MYRTYGYTGTGSVGTVRYSGVKRLRYSTGTKPFYNVKICSRFVFLPENSTHFLQPLDVATFTPMKRRWREILSQWKEDCIRKGINYATIPKRVCKPHPQVVPYGICSITVQVQGGTGSGTRVKFRHIGLIPVVNPF
jgi:hypothetical protein